MERILKNLVLFGVGPFFGIGRVDHSRPNKTEVRLTEQEALDVVSVLEGRGLTPERRKKLASNIRRRL